MARRSRPISRTMTIGSAGPWRPVLGSGGLAIHLCSREVGSRKQEVTAMGLLLILLGLAAAGLVADFVVENDLSTAPHQAVSFLGGSFRFSLPEVVLGGAVAGAFPRPFWLAGGGVLCGSLWPR